MVLALFLVASAPLVETRYYWSALARGDPRLTPESIADTMETFVLGLRLLAPLIVLICWVCLRRYPGAVPLAAWNRRRPWWSWAWTLLLGGGVLIIASDLFEPTYAENALFLAQSIGTIYLLLSLRAAVVSQERKAH